MKVIPCKTILDLLPIMVWVSTPDTFVVEHYNKAWYDYTGLTEQQMKEGWSDIVHPDDLGMVINVLTHAQATSTPYEVEFRMLSGSDGTYSWFSSKCTPIFDGKSLSGWVGMSFDISPYKLTKEKELEYQEALLHKT